MTSAEPLANPELQDVLTGSVDSEPRVELPLAPSRRVGESIDWARIWPFLLLQATCLLVFVVGWSPVAVITCVALYLVRMFGITAFYHRYFSHRTFRVGRGMQFVGALLGVPLRPSTMSFSLRCERTGIEYNGADLDRLFVQRRNLLRPSHWGM
ncbi:MAG: hypothetical protein ACK6D1_07460, partial [Planctomycetota bacterium]